MGDTKKKTGQKAARGSVVIDGDTRTALYRLQAQMQITTGKRISVGEAIRSAVTKALADAKKE